MRLILIIPILAVALQADPITVIETKSAFGITSLSYFYNLPTSIGGVEARVDASAGCLFAAIPCPVNDPATAIIELTLDLYTAGPVRDGIALVQLVVDGDGDAGGTTRESAAIGPYSAPFCAKGLSCHLSGYFPFQLGVPFTLDVYALAYGFAPMGGAGDTAFASIQLYETPQQGGGVTGAPVQIYLIPEPSAAALAISGLFTLMILAAIRRRRLFPR
jgi:hypothetical protein